MASSSYTFCGLESWYKHEFEHFGWMVLAHQNPEQKQKVQMYHDSIVHLMNAIQEKINLLKNEDNKNDLTIMWKELSILLQSVRTLFQISA